MKRFKHNLSNYKLATMDMGKLYPVQLQEVLPGDTFQMETSALIRVSPMLAPVMHPCTVRFHHWFVPNRILWDGWEDFITGGPDGQNADTIPKIDITQSEVGSLADYFGIPPSGDTLSVNALPFRAFNTIWNEFYRDQDLQTERALDDITIPHVSWRKDYFTAARPWQQKGPDLTLPIGTTAPIMNSGGAVHVVGQSTTGNPSVSGNGITFSNVSGSPLTSETSNNNITVTGDGSNDWTFTGGTLDVDSTKLVADLSQATGVSADQFREFFALQRYAEARARYGSRYTEYLRYLGVKPSDARLQRPEYLGGGKQTLQFSEILQTAYDENSPVATLRGHGITALKTKPTRRFFEEHGYVITLVSVVPKSIYQDGIQRTFLKQYKEEIFQKELQSIGQQEIKQGEVYGKVASSNNEIFGYTDRYSEYTSAPSTVSGEFRTTLDFWHLARKFETVPALNEDFIKCNPSKRIFASQSNDTLWCMINNKVISRRMVRKVSIGRLM